MPALVRHVFLPNDFQFSLPTLSFPNPNQNKTHSPNRATESHMLAAAQERRNERARAAFGLDDKFEDG